MRKLFRFSPTQPCIHTRGSRKSLLSHAAYLPYPGVYAVIALWNFFYNFIAWLQLPQGYSIHMPEPFPHSRRHEYRAYRASLWRLCNDGTCKKPVSVLDITHLRGVDRNHLVEIPAVETSYLVADVSLARPYMGFALDAPALLVVATLVLLYAAVLALRRCHLCRWRCTQSYRSSTQPWTLYLQPVEIPVRLRSRLHARAQMFSRQWPRKPKS